jgi:RNA polymerase sigma-70 factor (ECF subfamily)
MAQHMPQDGVAELVARYHGELFAYAYRLTGSAADAEDLTQQTYLAACAAFASLRDPNAARAWLYAILRSQYLKHFCRPSGLVFDEGQTELDQIPEELPAEPEFDQELLQRALDSLPTEFKVVVLMFYFEGCSYKEIARQLNLPPGTVMSRLARAKQRLRKALLHDAQLGANGRYHQILPHMVSHGTTPARG